MKQNKKYRALKRLIGKITKSNAPLNNSFSYYNYTVGQYRCYERLYAFNSRGWKH